MDESLKNWCHISASGQLQETLNALRSPEALQKAHPGKLLKGTLRPYQETGVAWLQTLTSLGLGACLADDMGLGKTIQVISLLLLKAQNKPNLPSLLVLPASLLANWKAEINRFAPSLNILMLHPSEMNRSAIDGFSTKIHSELKDFHLVITTYGMLLRQTWLTDIKWQLIILDEAQAIKNPSLQ